jgi:hypothetical protein
MRNVLSVTAVDNGKFKAFWMKSDERIGCKISFFGWKFRGGGVEDVCDVWLTL